MVWNKGLNGEEYRKHYPNGFKGGMKAGYKMSEESKENMSKSRIGMKFTKEHRENISKAKKGIKYNLSTEQRKKISQRMTGKNNCMKRKEVRDKLSKSKKGKKFSTEHKNNMSKTNHMRRFEDRKKHSAKLQGIPIGEWSGFKSDFNRRLRSGSKWKIWRELVFLRDNFTCQNSNCEYCDNKIGVMLHPHHIKPLAQYPELAFKIENGITYCKEFHLGSGLHSNIKTIQKEMNLKFQ